MKPICLDKDVVDRVTSTMRGLLRGGWGPIDPKAAYYPVEVVHPINIVRHPTTIHNPGKE